jgi:hypothetical protein
MNIEGRFKLIDPTGVGGRLVRYLLPTSQAAKFPEGTLAQ